MRIKKFEQFLGESFSENTYLLSINDKCILIDPGMIGSELQTELDKYELQFVILTHGHADHFLGIKDLKVPIYISKTDLFLVRHPEYSYANQFNNNDKFNDKEFIDITKLPLFEGKKFKLFSTPGHTKGSMCVQIEDRLFTGDTLFVDTIGRTDLYSGNTNEITKSLRLLEEKIGNNTIIYPGHGGKAKFKIVKQRNSYLK